MSTLTSEDKKELLKLARSVIVAELLNQKLQYNIKISSGIKQKRGCFVTLHKKGSLRGCIGNIEPDTSLHEGVKNNSINAAFHDPRFPPVTQDELSEIDIEISVLTIPKTISYNNGEELKAQLKPYIHGVILSKGWHRSTFLPQVWEQLPDKEMFLVHLCQKGGMEKFCWKDGDVIVKVYEAEYFSEQSGHK